MRIGTSLALEWIFMGFMGICFKSFLLFVLSYQLFLFDNPFLFATSATIIGNPLWIGVFAVANGCRWLQMCCYLQRIIQCSFVLGTADDTFDGVSL